MKNLPLTVSGLLEQTNSSNRVALNSFQGLVNHYNALIGGLGPWGPQVVAYVLGVFTMNSTQKLHLSQDSLPLRNSLMDYVKQLEAGENLALVTSATDFLERSYFLVMCDFYREGESCILSVETFVALGLIFALQEKAFAPEERLDLLHESGFDLVQVVQNNPRLLV